LFAAHQERDKLAGVKVAAEDASPARAPARASGLPIATEGRGFNVFAGITGLYRYQQYPRRQMR
jgi:hypothetical protein